MSPPNADGGSLVQEAVRSRAAAGEASSEAAAAPTILIVDDDPVVRSLMQAALEDEGYAVVEAADGIAAASLCREATPALLVVDAIMPNMDGFALCQELRRHAATRHVPIL